MRWGESRSVGCAPSGRRSGVATTVMTRSAAHRSGPPGAEQGGPSPDDFLPFANPTWRDRSLSHSQHCTENNILSAFLPNKDFYAPRRRYNSAPVEKTDPGAPGSRGGATGASRRRGPAIGPRNSKTE
ncbi:hypothetical protein NL676_033355 [Syzygium grande]|nr:hypothetical protein NL676_033355 [Syzygium grande]